jgi:hypothetical protein
MLWKNGSPAIARLLLHPTCPGPCKLHWTNSSTVIATSFCPLNKTCLSGELVSKPDRKRSLVRTKDMNETEDYPGPTHGHPDKQGQDPKGQADEDMVKPPARPETEMEQKKNPHPREN